MTHSRVVSLFALVISLFVFLIDWSAFDKWDPQLIHPKPIRDVWWHFPIQLLVVWVACRWLLREKRKDR